jgi:hypothetical protein
MKFYEIPLESKFKILSNNEECKKIKEERISCCKVKHNAIRLSTNENIVVKPMEEVELIK